MNLPPDFSDLLAEFDSAGVEFVVVGGYAVAFHARPRATKDIDLVVAGDADNLARVANALVRFGAPADVAQAARSMAETEIVYVGQPPLRVDILRSIDGVSTRDLFDHAVKTSWNGVSVRVIGLDELIANKRAAGRPQDAIDVALLEKVRARKP